MLKKDNKMRNNLQKIQRTNSTFASSNAQADAACKRAIIANT